MELIRDLDNRKVRIIYNGELLLELGFTFDEFTYVFYTNEPILINNELDSDFFKSLNEIFDNDYYFSHKYSEKKDDTIVWLSDGYANIEDEFDCSLINRLIIKRIDDKIYLSVFNPYFVENNLEKDFNVISFSPAGNGFLSKNLKNGASFQDDIINAFWKTLFNKKVAIKII